MKKTISALFCAALLLTAGCSAGADNKKPESSDSISAVSASVTDSSAEVGSASSGGSGTESTEAGGYRQISQEEAKELMQKENGYIILDVRTQQEYDEGHIPNAICIPNETITEEDTARLPDKEQLIFVYCRSGRRSKEAAAKLAKAGYSNIVEFGGIIDWTGEIEL